MADKRKPDPAKPAVSKPDPATLMAMFAEDQGADAHAKHLPPAAVLSAVANEAWRGAQPKAGQKTREATTTGAHDPVEDDGSREARAEPPGAQPSWMRIKADEQRFTSVRFSPELTEVLRHLAFLTRQSKTSLLNEALIDLVKKYRKAGVALPELDAEGRLKA